MHLSQYAKDVCKSIGARDADMLSATIAALDHHNTNMPAAADQAPVGIAGALMAGARALKAAEEAGPSQAPPAGSHKRNPTLPRAGEKANAGNGGAGVGKGCVACRAHGIDRGRHGKYDPCPYKPQPAALPQPATHPKNNGQNKRQRIK